MKQSGIFLVSNFSEVKDLIRKGPLHRYPIVIEVNRDKGTIRRWLCFSKGKRRTLLRYLFGKLLWDELSNFERRVFFSLEEVTKEFTIYLSLKALILGTTRRDLRKRLENGSFLGFWTITRQQYLGIKGEVDFFLIEEELHPQRTPKYSGYTKHYKDKGSLRPHVETYVPETDDLFESIPEKLLLDYLTVGKIPFFQGEGIGYPEEDQLVRNGNSLINIKNKLMTN